MDELPPGHPSSPYETDGSPRQLAVRLRDLDPAAEDEDAELVEANPTRTDTPDSDATADKIRPLTDAQWSERVADVRIRLADAHEQDLDTDIQYTIDGAGEIWLEDRIAVHTTIIEHFLAKSSHVPCEYKALIAGGLGGAGKSTTLDQDASIDRSQYLTINPDNIKVEMAERGLIPDVDGLTPMEASELVHEETSYIAKQLALRAQAEGKNIIWDITMSTRNSTERRIDELRESGYDRVDGIFVDIPVELSIDRADFRHRVDHEDYRNGDGFGGRYVPPEVTRAQADPHWGSQNRRTFEEVKQRFDSWSLYDNSVHGRAALLIEASVPPDFEHEETPR
jgi:predicted ABC-type ATPase